MGHIIKTGICFDSVSDSVPLRERMSRFGGFSGPYFPVFGVNTEIYRVTTRINSEYSKIRTRKTPKLDFFRLVINFSNLLFILRVLP